MKKATYVELGKPLEFKRFEKFKAPMGWNRLDILKRKLRENKSFRAKFTKTEIKKIRSK